MTWFDKDIYSGGPFIIRRRCHDIDCKRISSFQHTLDFKAELIPYMDNSKPPK
jgi:hypothetical protein